MPTEHLKIIIIKLVLALLFALSLFYTIFYFIGQWLEKVNSTQGFSIGAFLWIFILFIILVVGVVFYFGINKKGFIRSLTILIGGGCLLFTLYGLSQLFTG